jgi:transcriptional regulator
MISIVVHQSRCDLVEKSARTQYDTQTLYVPAPFKEERIDVLHELMRAHPLATLVAVGDSGLMANHIPLKIESQPAPWGTLRGHVARANPVWRDYRLDSEALAIFQGPHSYISPSLYRSKQTTGEVVPTWNYVVVQARGTLRFIHETDWLREFVGTLTDDHEASRAQPWKVDDAPAAYMGTMLKLIVGFEFSITSITGKWKLGQNRTLSDRQGLAEGMQRSDDGDARELARMLADREPPSADR